MKLLPVYFMLISAIIIYSGCFSRKNETSLQRQTNNPTSTSTGRPTDRVTAIPTPVAPAQLDEHTKVQLNGIKLFCKNGQQNDYFGRSISLSRDGTTLAVGSGHHFGFDFLSMFTFYEKDGTSWDKIGQVEDCANLSLSSDGKTVIMGGCITPLIMAELEYQLETPVDTAKEL